MDFKPATPADLALATERMKRLAQAVIGNEHDAEDAAQEAWCRALGTGHSARNRDAWLAGVARNVAREQRRARRRRRRRETAATSESQSPNQLALEHLDALHALVHVVRGLDEPYRAALTLQYVMGMTPADAAEALSVNRATLRSRVHRGLALVRAELDRGPDNRPWQAALAPLLTGPITTTVGGLIVSKSTSLAGAAILLLLLSVGGYALLPGYESAPPGHADMDDQVDAPGLRGQSRRGGAAASAAADLATGTDLSPPAPAAATPAQEQMQRWSRLTSRKAQRVAAWRKKIEQVADPALRAEGLRELVAALGESDSGIVESALMVFPHIRDLPYDREEFRRLVLPLIGSNQPLIPSRAARALGHIRPDPTDPARIIALFDADLGADGQLLPYLFPAGEDRRTDGRLADLFILLLRADDPKRSLEVAAALNGTWVTDEVHAAAVAAFRRHGSKANRRDWHLAVARLLPRRAAGVEAVFALLSTPDPQNTFHGYVLDALGTSIADDAQSLAAERAGHLLLRSEDHRVRMAALRAFRAVGTSQQAGAVHEFVANPMVSSSERRRARGVLKHLESRR